MNSFSFGTQYGVDEIPEDVLLLFKDAVVKDYPVEHASEIISAGITGGIDTSKPFNMYFYDKKLDKYEKLDKRKRAKKHLYLEQGSGSDWEETRRSGGISEENLYVEVVSDEFDKLLDQNELEQAVKNIKNLESDLYKVEHVRITGVIKAALVGVPSAVKKLRDICNFYPLVDESVRVILESGEDVQALLA